MVKGMKIAAPSCQHELATKEIERGRDLMAQLGALLLPTNLSDHRSELAAGLFKDALQAFAAALSSLQTCGSPESCSRPAATQVGPDKKRKSPERGVNSTGHGRRRVQHSWRTVTSNPHYDGHVWRKFGHKNISGSIYPRSYFRCTYRDDQGCQATKRVQQMGEGYPPKYAVTYIMQHSCKPKQAISPVVINSTPRNDSVLVAEDNLITSLAAEDENNYCKILPELSELDIESPAANTPDACEVTWNKFSPASAFSLDMEWMNDGFGWIA